MAVLLLAREAQAGPTVLVVVGAPGSEEYGRQFVTWSERWERAARDAGAQAHVIGRTADDKTADRDQLLQLLAAAPKEGPDELWLILIGHGTDDGRAARFNLRGPDLADAELAKAIEPFRRPVVVINCTSCSGPFIKRLSAPGRVVVTATRSGNEQNFARFGDYISAAISDRSADYDKDDQVSLLEAFLAASRRVAESYRTDSRLATEHALVDDNGDGLGTPGDWFRGIRAVKRAQDGAALDGHRAHQFVLVRSLRERNLPAELIARRRELEVAVAELRDRKATMPEEAYYQDLEKHLLALARLQEIIDQRGPESR